MVSPTPLSYYLVPALNTLLLLVAFSLSFLGVREISREKLGRSPWLRLVLVMTLAGLMLNPLNVIANHLTSWFLQPASSPEMKMSILVEGGLVIGVLGWMYKKFKTQN